MSAWAARLLARSLNPRYEGRAISSRMPMITITTRSSISVKPSSRASRCRKLDMHSPLGVVDTRSGWDYGVATAPEQSADLCQAVAPGPLTLQLTPLTVAPRQYVVAVRLDGATRA